MTIKKVTAETLYDVWQNTDTHNFKYFYDNIASGNMDFYAMYHDSMVIGELYALKTSVDPDEAGGKRVYLLAFRIQEAYQGQGKGRQLMGHVLESLEKQGYEEFTLGVDPQDFIRLKAMYEGWGFDQMIKETYWDYHCFDDNHQPLRYEEPSVLLMRRADGR